MKKPNISNIASKINSLENFYKDLGVATYLCAKSSYHQKFTSGHIMAYIVPALRFKQYKIYYKDLNPVAIVCWTFLSDQISDAYKTGDYVLRMNDYNSGDNAWVTEFVVADDNEKIREEVILDLRHNIFKEKDVRVVVRNDDGSVKRIFISQGIGKKIN